MSCDTAAAWPSSVTLHRATRTLELAWEDAGAAVPHQRLRQACRCGECENLRRYGPVGVRAPADVELLRIEPVGEVGLQFFFSDGHKRGIFPWAYLREIALASNENHFLKGVL